MKFVSDPVIAIKIDKMNQRVRWQDPLIAEKNIDQTAFVLDDQQEDNPEFSFLVIGDSGSSMHKGHDPQRQIAEQMLPHRDACRFVLHTGDVIYLVGSSEYYQQNFIDPYREFLLGGESFQKIKYDQIVFEKPIFPVLGNHDYYDLPMLYGFMAKAALSLSRLVDYQLDLDIGWHGSDQGKAYATAFLDCLQRFNLSSDLNAHLDQHYTAQTNHNRCLRYQPSQFTRLPNRYYTFRSGGIDFFALDSNTFNDPLPLPKTAEGAERRRALENQREQLEQQKNQLMMDSTKAHPVLGGESELLEDSQAKLNQLEESTLDIDKQLTADYDTTTVDFEQLNWLKEKLIASWHNPEVRGRIIYFHHPPYVTEATKWDQGQTLAVRDRLRQVLDAVAESVGSLAGDRPLVDLALTGHAHCLEHLRTGNTGHGDSHINWLVCGGSGHSLRRQRVEGRDLTERINNKEQLVARSLLYVGRNGQGYKKRRPYSFLRIDVKPGTPPKFIVRPFVSERFQNKWHDFALEAIAFSS